MSTTSTSSSDDTSPQTSRFSRSSSLIKTCKRISLSKFMKSENSLTVTRSSSAPNIPTRIISADYPTLPHDEFMLPSSRHQNPFQTSQTREQSPQAATKASKMSRIFSFSSRNLTEEKYPSSPKLFFSRPGRVQNGEASSSSQTPVISQMSLGNDRGLSGFFEEENNSEEPELLQASLSVSDEENYRTKGGAENGNNPKPSDNHQKLQTEKDQRQQRQQQQQQEQQRQPPCNHHHHQLSSSSLLASSSQRSNLLEPLFFQPLNAVATPTTPASSASQDSAPNTTTANTTQLSSSPAPSPSSSPSSFPTTSKANPSLPTFSLTSFSQQLLLGSHPDSSSIPLKPVASASSAISDQHEQLQSPIVPQNIHITQESVHNNNQASSVTDTSTSSLMLISNPDSTTEASPSTNMELSPNSSTSPEQRQSNDCQDYSDMEVDSSDHIIQGISSSSNSPPPISQANGENVNTLAHASDGATANTPTTNVQQLDAQSSDNDEDEDPYSIRLTPFIDHSSTTPALYISAVERKAHNGMVIRVGRYTERKETPAPKPEHAPIVFKSKVVSRSHAQLTVQDGQWFIQDVKSSSGTFLNHVRLSAASQQSQPYALKDGDILQLGMDFRGGSEEIYKCIKVRVEVNKSWQKRVNNFK